MLVDTHTSFTIRSEEDVNIVARPTYKITGEKEKEMDNHNIFKQLQHIKNMEIQLGKMKENLFDHLVLNSEKELGEAALEEIAVSLCKILGTTYGVKFFRTYIKMGIKEAWEYLKSSKRR